MLVVVVLLVVVLLLELLVLLAALLVVVVLLQLRLAQMRVVPRSSRSRWCRRRACGSR